MNSLTGNPFKSNGGEALTAAQFLGKDPKVKGVFKSSEEFINYGKSLSNIEVEQFKQCVTFIKQKLPISGTLFPRKDRGSRIYLHPSFRQASGSSIGVKLVLIPELAIFLDLVLKNEVEINFTGEELIAEALKED